MTRLPTLPDPPMIRTRMRISYRNRAPYSHRGTARDAVGSAINASVMRLEERLQLAGGVVDGGGFSRERCWIGRIVIHADRVSIASVAGVVVTGNRVVID